MPFLLGNYLSERTWGNIGNNLEQTKTQQQIRLPFSSQKSPSAFEGQCRGTPPAPSTPPTLPWEHNGCTDYLKNKILYNFIHGKKLALCFISLETAY